jgi:transcriptional regulator with XRE-family HTH domain
MAQTTLGEWIQKGRAAKGWTQLQLALHFEIDPGTASRWERNKLVPDANQLRALCELFGSSADVALSLPLPGRRKRAAGENGARR